MLCHIIEFKVLKIEEEEVAMNTENAPPTTCNSKIARVLNKQSSLLCLMYMIKGIMNEPRKKRLRF